MEQTRRRRRAALTGRKRTTVELLDGPHCSVCQSDYTLSLCSRYETKLRHVQEMQQDRLATLSTTHTWFLWWTESSAYRTQPHASLSSMPLFGRQASTGDCSWHFHSFSPSLRPVSPLAILLFLFFRIVDTVCLTAQQCQSIAKRRIPNNTAGRTRADGTGQSSPWASQDAFPSFAWIMGWKLECAWLVWLVGWDGWMDGHEGKDTPNTSLPPWVSPVLLNLAPVLTLVSFYFYLFLCICSILVHHVGVV